MLKKLCIYFLCGSFLAMYSCAAKKIVKNEDTQVVKTSTEPKPNGDKVEVVVLKDVTKDSKPPIQVPPAVEADKTGKNSEVEIPSNPDRIYNDRALDQEFNITMILPFSEQNSDRFFQYYCGAKIASKELEKEGSKLNITMIDANDIDYLSKIGKSADLIIAPNEEKQIKALAEYGKQKNIPVLSSFFSLSSITENPYYIQTRPSLKLHYAGMIADVERNHNLDDVVIIGRKGKSESSWFEPFQSEGRRIKNKPDGKPFAELLLDEAMLTFNSVLSAGKKIFVFPNFSFKDEDFLLAALAKLNEEKGSRKIVVYAMSIVKDSEKISKELIQSINVKIPTSKFIDNGMEETRKFTNDFYISYLDLPSPDAFEGADNMLFIGRALSRYGKMFPEHFYKLNEDYLHTSFDMRSVSKQNPGTIDFYENQHIKILSFDGTTFRP